MGFPNEVFEWTVLIGNIILVQQDFNLYGFNLFKSRKYYLYFLQNIFINFLEYIQYVKSWIAFNSMVALWLGLEFYA